MEKDTFKSGKIVKHRHPLYDCWKNIIQSVDRKNHKQYRKNKLRGVKYDKRWSIFQNFVDDMGPKKGGQYLKRINKFRDYEKDNCIWETLSYMK